MLRSNLKHILKRLTPEISDYIIIESRLEKINVQLYKDLSLEAAYLSRNSQKGILKDFNKHNEKI